MLLALAAMNKNKRSIHLLIGLAVYLALILLIYHFESRGRNPNIHTVFDAVWYSLVTLTTVGYGDFYPTTLAGKILSATLIFASLGVLGYFIGKLTEYIQIIAERRKMGLDGTDFSNHVVIVGWDEFAEGVLTQLANADKRACVITDNKDHLEIIRDRFKRGFVFPIYADYANPDGLEKAAAGRAAMLMPNLGDDTKNLVFILNAKKRHPNLVFIVTLDNAELKETFQSAGVNYTISRNEVSSKIVASYIFEPSVARFSEDLLSSAWQDDDYDIQQYYVTPDCRFAGASFGQVFKALKDGLNVLAIGLSRADEGRQFLTKLPPDALEVLAGDYVVVMTSGRSVKDLEAWFGCDEGLYYADAADPA